MESADRPPNRFLNLLSATDFEALRSDLKIVELPEELTLARVGDAVTKRTFRTRRSSRSL